MLPLRPLIVALSLSAAPVLADVTITQVAGDLDDPWALDFLPGGDVLVTLKAGELIRLGADGARVSIKGVPKVVNSGQGGLLDVMVPRDFAQSREIFLTYAGPQGRGAATTLAKARLSEDGASLGDVTVLFQQAEGFTASKHFGSRVVESTDGTLFVTVGERGTQDAAQDLRNHNGSVVRITRSGAVPADNPFVGQADAQPELWSYGHRNPQGAALDLEGNLWTVEHGAKGGDEINAIKPGANYGWPVISYGRHYSGRKIGVGTEAAGMEQPAHYWDPSIAPSGMAIHTGSGNADWRGDFFVGSLKFDYISQVDGASLREVAQIKSPATARVRDVVEGPNGALWFLSQDNAALYKLTP